MMEDDENSLLGTFLDTIRREKRLVIIECNESRKDRR